MFEKVKRLLRLISLRKKWREKNMHNFTYAKNHFKLSDAVVGNYTYGGIMLLNEVEKIKLHIGSFCSIAEEVTFLLGDDHFTDMLSTYPFRAKVLKEIPAETTSKGDIYVDDDVWIGKGASILSGVHIGQGAVIAAGAIVTKDIPPYAIACGVPAKVVKYRFEQDVIDYLLTFDYSKLNENLISGHLEELYTSLENKTLDEIKELYKWFPKTDNQR